MIRTRPKTAPGRRTAFTGAEAAFVKAMLLRGDPIHDIAAWYQINSARVADVKSGKTHRGVKAAAVDAPGMPPLPPYLVVPVRTPQDAAVISALAEVLRDLRGEILP